MDVVVTQTINKYYEHVRDSLYKNDSFKKFKSLADECGFSVIFELNRIEEKKRIYFFLSTNCLTEYGSVFLVPPDSVYYDELGSLGASECILQYDKKKKHLIKYNLTNEFFDDIEKSTEFLLFFKSTLEQR